MRKNFLLGTCFILMFLLLIPFTTIAADSSSKVQIPNPLRYSTFEELIACIIDFLKFVAIPVALIMVVVAAYYLIIQGDQPEKVTMARKMIIYILIGIGIILIAEGLLYVIGDVLGLKDQLPDWTKGCPD